MQDVGSKENTSVSGEDLTPDGESRLSNPLDTVSLLEIGLHSRITLQRRRGLAGQSRFLFFLRENIR